MNQKYPIHRYERQLENGMKVILLHKPEYVKSLFMIGIPAGSMNIWEECNGQFHQYPQGCAHFLEHQMFRLNGKDVTHQIAEVRAQTNAFTSYGETCYYVWTSADPLPSLSLLMDFVETLDIDEKSVEKEKGIILSEYQQYDQQPDSRLLKETFRLLYQNHALNEDILGKPEDIQNMRVEDLTRFYNAYYDPAQLVLVGVTGKDPESIFSFVEEAQKKYPSRASDRARRLLPEEPEELAGVESTVAMDVDMGFACLGVKFKPEASKKEAIIHDYMLNIWLTAQFSPLNPQFQTWIDQEILSGSAAAEADLDVDHAYLLFFAQTDRMEEFKAIAQSILDEKKPLSADVFESLKIRNTASALRLIDQFDNLAIEHVRGNFEGYDPLEDPAIIAQITLEQLNDYIASLDFSKQVFCKVVPLENQPQSIESE